MDSYTSEIRGGWIRTADPSYLDATVDERESTAVLVVSDRQGFAIVKVGLDFAAASELMIWLNTNIHRLMGPGDQEPRPTVAPYADTRIRHATTATITPWRLRIRCATCSDDAWWVTWGDPHPASPGPACAKHRQSSYVGLPELSQVSLACLYLVDREQGLSTKDYAERGAPSWTVRGTGNALYQLERRGLVEADKKIRPRYWYLTVRGAQLAPWLIVPTQA